MNSYKTIAAAEIDRDQLETMLDALNASPSSLCRDVCGLWVLQGSRGYISTWGDGSTWHITVGEASSLKWSWVKKRLPFCELTQDGDWDGCFRIRRLPTPDEANVVRDVVGLRKRVEYSPEELQRRRDWARQQADL